MEKNSKTIGIIISIGIVVLMGAILVQILADQTQTKVGYAFQTDTFTLVREPSPSTLYNTSRGINTTYTYTLSKVDDAWRQDFPACAKAFTIDPTAGAVGNLRLYNASGTILENGVDYVIVSGVNSITFENTALINQSANTVSAKYRTCPATEYVGGWGQTVLKMVPGFFALAILIGAAFCIFWILRQEGIQIDV